MFNNCFVVDAEPQVHRGRSVQRQLVRHVGLIGERSRREGQALHPRRQRQRHQAAPVCQALSDRHLHQAEDGQVHHGGQRENVGGAGREELQQSRKVIDNTVGAA